jgi:hypothetical protein
MLKFLLIIQQAKSINKLINFQPALPELNGALTLQHLCQAFAWWIWQCNWTRAGLLAWTLGDEFKRTVHFEEVFMAQVNTCPPIMISALNLLKGRRGEGKKVHANSEKNVTKRVWSSRVQEMAGDGKSL